MAVEFIGRTYDYPRAIFEDYGFKYDGTVYEIYREQMRPVSSTAEYYDRNSDLLISIIKTYYTELELMLMRSNEQPEQEGI